MLSEAFVRVVEIVEIEKAVKTRKPGDPRPFEAQIELMVEGEIVRVFFILDIIIPSSPRT